MKVGLASDSYGNAPGLRLAFDRLVDAGAERIFFLGGRWSDVDAALAQARGAPPPIPPADGDLGFLRAVEGALARHMDDPAQKLAGRIVRVASRSCPEYRTDESRRKVFEMLGTLICCLVNDKADLSRDDIANATVLFHGNACEPAMVQIGPRYFVTPGHLGRRGSAGPPTFALLDVAPQGMELVVFSAGEGRELRRERTVTGTWAKVTVK